MKHLLSIADLSKDEVLAILDTATSMHEVQGREVKKLPTLRGRTIINFFFEDSTRTRSSFEIAGKWMSADTINITGKGTSVSKGESLRDTVLTIDAMGVDMMVIRHPASGAPKQIAAWVHCSIVNAGDGTHEHPTQALLDAFTIAGLDLPRFRTMGGAPAAVEGATGERPANRLAAFDFRGLRVAIIGDITHSRVARSNVHGLTRLGAEVTLCAPRTMMPVEMTAMGVRVTDRLDEALDGCDVAMALRLQLERQQAGLFPSLREYHLRYGLRAEHLERHPELRVMHPGPINRGVELAGEVADSDRSVILDQVTNGVAVRMAVLYLLAGGSAAARLDADAP